MTETSPRGEPPAAPDEEPRFTVSAVARRLGIAPATLRTWDRRYGLGPSAHAFGAHRRYTPRDVTRLLVMRRLVVEGVPPGEAARVALARDVAIEPAFEIDATGPAATATEGSASAPAAAPGGGRMLALPGASAEVRGLAAAAMTLDAPVMTGTVRSALRSRGVAATWHQLLVPVLTAIGDRWAATGLGVDVEHLLSESALVGLREVRASAPLDGDPRVILGCAADDYHALPLHALAAALSERRIGCRLLGGAVPGKALGAAARRVRPAVVFCWSSMPATGDAAYLAAVPVLAPPVTVIVGGPGWDVETLPPGVEIATDVPSAVGLITAHLGR